MPKVTQNPSKILPKSIQNQYKIEHFVNHVLWLAKRQKIARRSSESSILEGWDGQECIKNWAKEEWKMSEDIDASKSFKKASKILPKSFQNPSKIEQVGYQDTKNEGAKTRSKNEW